MQVKCRSLKYNSLFFASLCPNTLLLLIRADYFIANAQLFLPPVFPSGGGYGSILLHVTEATNLFVNVQLILSNKNWLKFFLKTFDREKFDVITYIIPNFGTLEPYVENFIICSGFWDSIGHPGGQPSVLSMYVTNRIKESIKDWR